LFYLAVTQFLGFPNYGDEYKVMGLAPYGEPRYLPQMRSLVRLHSGGRFSLGLKYFRHDKESVPMTWGEGEPQVGIVFGELMSELLGSPRNKAHPLEQRHMDLAASAQAMYEEAFFHLLNHVRVQSGETRLALAGGCAMNSVANGKIFDRTDFKNVYIQSAAGDAGGAIGAAYFVWNQVLQQPRTFSMHHSYWGPGFSPEQIGAAVSARSSDLASADCTVEICEEIPLIDTVASAISEGKVIGWFQGRMEWGPRALGNRSILGDPRRADMKDILNLKIKRRESFRPFAPSILREATPEWFETDYDVPFMLQVFQIREQKQSEIPAVTHVNGSGRLQTVTESQNARYYRLIRRFGELTGVPILLNTSFNENEPVVCRPEEALDCFLRTKMDVLVLGDCLIQRNAR
jgi:carbamoyltransferase